MSRYIDVGKQLVRLYRMGLSCEDVVKQFLLTAPAADVVEVVRCRECKHNIQGYCEYWGDRFHYWEECDLIDEDGFCHKGEKE